MRPSVLVARIALLPMAVTALVAYVGAALWTLRVSLSSSHSLPVGDWVGLAQYRRLYANERWLHSLDNLWRYGLLFLVATLLAGYLLALLVDRQARAGTLLRGIFLYPYALSFIATGLVWQWMLNPELGVQHVLQTAGFANARFDWLIDPDRVLYTLVIATAWQAAGLVMVILLAGLRGIDPDLWRAARVEGIPAWRLQLQVVLPQLTMPLATATLLLLTGVAKLYDAVVAMTRGGPGMASEVPAKFVMDHLFGRANIALASAAATSLLLVVAVLLAPLLVLRARAARMSTRAAA
jgi:glucose/mannose transport system permease protein